MTATVDNMKADLQRANAELQRQADAYRAERDEALQRETAAAEVLQVINSSPGDLQPVFDAILEKAARLCDAESGIFWAYQQVAFRPVACHGLLSEFARFLEGTPEAWSSLSLDLIERGEAFTHTFDLAEFHSSSTNPLGRAVVDLEKARTGLLVPLRREGVLLGAIRLFRHHVRPFSDKQIALLQNFAAQAVIAMENARLITETREALEYQTATSDVLQAINRSTFDLDAILQTVVTSARQLCRANYAVIFRNAGGEYRFAAGDGNSPEYKERESLAVIRVGRGSIIGRAALEGRAVQIADAWTDPDYEDKEGARIDGARSMLGVPLLHDGQAIAAIGLARDRIEPFSERETLLVTTFADQAVIAIENARLIAETKEALDQQTATAEVLQVINSSPGDLEPVFDAMLERAAVLCDADEGILRTFDGDLFHVAAVHGGNVGDLDSLRDLGPIRNARDSALFGPLVRGERVVHIFDVRETETYRDKPEARARLELRGVRTFLGIALHKEDVLVGALLMSRRVVRPFTDKQIALLQNFAAQAVIAMENARLITETREALEQQTATAEVLGVINASPGDLTPVFQAVLEKAMRLCSAAFGELQTYDGEKFSLAAMLGVPAAYLEFRTSRTHVYGPGTVPAKFVAGEGIQHIADVKASEAYRQGEVNRRALVDMGGARTVLAVPLRKEGALLGFINVYRQEVRPYSDSQVALLENFAAQAVIAMENARLLNEIRQRQVELRITFDNMADGVAMFDQSLHLAAWNRNFQEMLQLSDELLAARPGFDEYIRHLTDRGEFGDSDPETEIARLRSRLADHYSFERTRPDGTVIEVRHNPMPDGGIVLIFSDITERKRSEEEIRAARDAAETAYRNLQAAQANLVQAQKMAALGQLTAGIAHEIKNPLNFVNNFASLSVELLDELKETAAPAIAALDDDKRADVDDTMELLTGNLEKIAEHGKRADNIVKSMLEHSRGVSGERREVDLNGVIEEALNLAYHGARAQDQSFNITLERDYAPSLKPIEVAPQEMTRVFLNLFGNGFYAATKRARDNSDGSFRPVLTVATSDMGDAVEVRVRDNGIGIPAVIKDKLFQPFFTTKPTGEGTGLGLSISYDIITQQHGGTITVESEPGSFTEFTIRLPRD